MQVMLFLVCNHWSLREIRSCGFQFHRHQTTLEWFHPSIVELFQKGETLFWFLFKCSWSHKRKSVPSPSARSAVTSHVSRVMSGHETASLQICWFFNDVEFDAVTGRTSSWSKTTTCHRFSSPLIFCWDIPHLSCPNSSCMPWPTLISEILWSLDQPLNHK